MADTEKPSASIDLVRIEPEHRLVILARTIQATDPDAAIKEGALQRDRFREACIGSALYRHRSMFQNTSDAPTWNLVALTYFQNFIPRKILRELVNESLATNAGLLRAEILLTTPSSFVLPRNWQGVSNRPELQASLEFLDVQQRDLGKYRDAMRDYCGPAAQKLVRDAKFGTFRAMETIAVLYQHPKLNIDWNQLHLCELNPKGFEGFGKEFATALRADVPDGAPFTDVFSDLGRMRTVPRWTFNDAVVEMDTGLCAEVTFK